MKKSPQQLQEKHEDNLDKLNAVLVIGLLLSMGMIIGFCLGKWVYGI